jgi:acetolactate synthase-1/2/3 large subunit
MVRQMQAEDGDIAGVEFHDTDFVKAAEAFGAEATRALTPAALAAALETATSADVPYVVDVRIDRDEEMATSLQSSFYESVGGLHE